MNKNSEEYFESVLKKIKKNEPWTEDEVAQAETDFSLKFPEQLRALLLKAGDIGGWDTSRFTLLTSGEVEEIFAGEDTFCGEEFREEGYEEEGLFPFGSLDVIEYCNYVFLDTRGDVSGIRGAVIWKDFSKALKPSYLLLENTLAEFLDGIIGGTDYDEKVSDFCDEAGG